MAQFQKTHPREDTIQRRPLTMEDIAFLKDLQHTLNTQDTMGNADPRFWVIRQSQAVPCEKDEADHTAIIQTSACETVATNMTEFIKHLSERYDDWNFKAEPHGPCHWSASITALDDEEFSDDWISSPDDMIEFLENAGIHDYAASYSRTESENVQDTLFLTHAACEDHLRRYHYNYEPDAHAFAMTAIRSPQFERLISVLQTVDWDAIAKKGGGAP